MLHNFFYHDVAINRGQRILRNLDKYSKVALFSRQLDTEIDIATRSVRDQTRKSRRGRGRGRRFPADAAATKIATERSARLPKDRTPCAPEPPKAAFSLQTSWANRDRGHLRPPHQQELAPRDWGHQQNQKDSHDPSSSLARTRAWKGTCSPPTSDLARDSLSRNQKLKETYLGKEYVAETSTRKIAAYPSDCAASSRMISAYPTDHAACPRSTTTRRVTWADDHGSPLAASRRIGEGTSQVTPHLTGSRLSYKETLIRGSHHLQRSEAYSLQRPPPHLRPRPLFSKTDFKNRCFRCLASDHQIRNCRDPLCCAECHRTGHRGRHCGRRASPSTPKMHRGGDFRPHMTKVFIPLSEDFLNRQRQRQCAVLADVIGIANLGHPPQVTIASDLAARFGGFATDFLVAKHRERDFVLFLPEWVRPEDLVIN